MKIGIKYFDFEWQTIRILPALIVSYYLIEPMGFSIVFEFLCIRTGISFVKKYK